jgi:hypothetical protein
MITRILDGASADEAANELLRQGLVLAIQSLAPIHVNKNRVLCKSSPPSESEFVTICGRFRVYVEHDDYATYGLPVFTST